MFLQLVINSLAIGSLYALTAMGATLIYGILGILDIANAGAYLIGAYIGYYIYISTGQLVLAFLGAMLAVGLLGVVLHRTVYGPILAKPRMLSIIPLVAAVGLFTMCNDAVRLLCGAGTKAYNFRFPVDVIQVGSVTIQTTWLLIFALTAVLLAVLWVVLNKTKMGLAWRATAEDPDIARVLVTDPELIMLDEPCAGLSNFAINEVTELILKLKERKKSIVLIEHNLPITMKVCDRIMVLSYGKKIAEGPPEAVKHDKQVIEAYLGEEDEV